MFFLRPFSQVEGHDVEALVSNRVAEGLHLEFKEVRDDKVDLTAILQEVSAFANGQGGDLILGVSERKGKTSHGNATAEAITPIRDVAKVRQALENALVDRIDPKLPGVQAKVLETTSGDVLVIRAPQSFLSPHLVRHEGAFSCHVRNSHGKRPLDARELKNMFVAGDRAQETVRQRFSFRIDGWHQQLEAIGDENTWVFVQAQPLISYLSPFAIDLTEIERNPQLFGSHSSERKFFAHGGYRYNYDGVGLERSSSTYVQFYRNGGIECGLGRCAYGDGDAPDLLNPHSFRWTYDAIWDIVRAMRLFEVVGPVYVAVAYFNLFHLELPVMQFGGLIKRDHSYQFRRDVLSLPEFQFDADTVTERGLHSSLLSSYHVLAQAVNLPHFEPPGRSG